MNEEQILSNFRIRTVDFVYNEKNEISQADIRFDSSDANGEYLNGNVRIPFVDFESANNLEEVAEIAKTKVREKFSA